MATGQMVSHSSLPPIPLVYNHAITWLEQLQFMLQVHFSKADMKSVFLAHCGMECFTLLANLVAPDHLVDTKLILLQARSIFMGSFFNI
jgi:hypothetical protein